MGSREWLQRFLGLSFGSLRVSFWVNSNSSSSMGGTIILSVRERTNDLWCSLISHIYSQGPFLGRYWWLACFLRASIWKSGSWFRGICDLGEMDKESQSREVFLLEAFCPEKVRLWNLANLDEMRSFSCGLFILPVFRAPWTHLHINVEVVWILSEWSICLLRLDGASYFIVFTRIQWPFNSRVSKSWPFVLESWVLRRLEWWNTVVISQVWGGVAGSRAPRSLEA